MAWHGTSTQLITSRLLFNTMNLQFQGIQFDGALLT